MAELCIYIYIMDEKTDRNTSAAEFPVGSTFQVKVGTKLLTVAVRRHSWPIITQTTPPAKRSSVQQISRRTPTVHYVSRGFRSRHT